MLLTYDSSQSLEFFKDATYEELGEICSLLDFASPGCLDTLLEWVEGDSGYYPWGHAISAQYIIQYLIRQKGSF
jgi:hypothetical protein